MTGWGRLIPPRPKSRGGRHSGIQPDFEIESIGTAAPVASTFIPLTPFWFA